MSEYVFFSPIGNTDPITGQHDGAFLHICRHYKPKKVYLYLSKEMYEHHNTDNRYLYSLEELGKLLNHKFEYELIIRENLVDVQIFDFFYSEFEECIKKISQETDAMILLNVSSGTPAMKAALQTLAVLSEHKYIPIQVSTPAKQSNEDKKTYEKELQWECNIDNTESTENRCQKSSGINLRAVIQKELILKHISDYDYNAALSVAQTIKEYVGDKLIDLLEAAVARVRMDQSTVDKKLRNTDIKFNTVQSDYMLLIESILWLQIKEKRGDYVDFVRGITPIMTELFRLCLKNVCKIDIEQYCIKKSTSMRPDFLDIEKVKKFDINFYNLLNKLYDGSFKSGYISSELLCRLICHYSKDSDLINKIKILNDIDGKTVRHIAAHTLTAITDEWITKRAGFSSAQILEMIKDIVFISHINNKQELWNSYDDMNEMIKKAL